MTETICRPTLREQHGAHERPPRAQDETEGEGMMRLRISARSLGLEVSADS